MLTSNQELTTVELGTYNGCMLLPVSGGFGTCVALRLPLCGGAVSSPRPCSARTDEPVLSLAPPAGPGSPWALGYPDAHRARTERRSPLGAMAAHHTGGRDAAWHGLQGSGGMSARTRYLWTWGTRLSSLDGRGVGAPLQHATLSGARAPPVPLACARTRPRHGGPPGTVWPQAAG